VSIRAVKIRTQPPVQRHVQPPDLRAPSCIRNYGLRDRSAYCIHTRVLHASRDGTRACQSPHGRYAKDNDGNTGYVVHPPRCIVLRHVVGPQEGLEAREDLAVTIDTIWGSIIK